MWWPLRHLISISREKHSPFAGTVGQGPGGRARSSSPGEDPSHFTGCHLQSESCASGRSLFWGDRLQGGTALFVWAASGASCRGRGRAFLHVTGFQTPFKATESDRPAVWRPEVQVRKEVPPGRGSLWRLRGGCVPSFPPAPVVPWPVASELQRSRGFSRMCLCPDFPSL